MAYDRKKLEQQALEAIKQHNLTFITDVVAYIPITRATYYDMGFDKSDTLKDAIEENKLKTKNNLKAKWYKSQNATLQLALYKLISSDDERKKLSQAYTDITTDGDKIQNTLQIEWLGDKPNDQDTTG